VRCGYGIVRQSRRASTLPPEKGGQAPFPVPEKGARPPFPVAERGPGPLFAQAGGFARCSRTSRRLPVTAATPNFFSKSWKINRLAVLLVGLR